MTKEMANEIRKVLKQNGWKGQMVYRNPEQIFRIEVNVYYDNTYSEKKEAIEKATKQSIHKVLVILQNNGFRPRFEIEHRRFQGFINVICLKFR